MKLKNFEDAEAALKKATNLAPDNEWFLDELYGYYATQNDYDNAINVIKQLVKYHPDYKEDLATLYVRTNKYDAALTLLDELDAELGLSKSRDSLRNRVYDATGKKDEQIENLKARIFSNPDNESHYLALIFRYSENNEKEKAFETAKNLLKINPNSQLVHLALYKFYLDDNNAEEAIASMKIVVKSSDIKPDAKLKVLSDFVNFVKENPEYEADLVEATNLVSDTDNEKSLVELGQYYLSKKNKEKALEYFVEALKTDADNFSILRSVMLLQIDLKQFSKAELNSRKALQNYPSQPIFYLVNGVASNALNNPEAAIESLDMGLDYIIDDAQMEIDFYTQLSKSYTLLNNTVKAKTFSDKAKQIQLSN